MRFFATELLSLRSCLTHRSVPKTTQRNTTCQRTDLKVWPTNRQGLMPCSGLTHQWPLLSHWPITRHIMKVIPPFPFPLLHLWLPLWFSLSYPLLGGSSYTTLQDTDSLFVWTPTRLPLLSLFCVCAQCGSWKWQTNPTPGWEIKFLVCLLMEWRLHLHCAASLRKLDSTVFSM